MKYFAPATLLLLTATNAAAFSLHNEAPALKDRSPVSLVVRDLASVTSAINSISGALKAATSEVQAFNSDPAAVNSAMQALSSSIQAGTTTVQASAALTLEDATKLAPIVQGLGDDAKALAGTLSDKKGALEQAGQCSSLLGQALNINVATQGLVTAIVDKIPQEAKAPASLVAGLVTSSVQQSLQIFDTANCRTGGANAAVGAPALLLDAATTGGAAAASTCACPPASSTSRPPTTSAAASTSRPPTTSAPASTSRPPTTSASSARPSSSSARPSNSTTARPPTVTAGGSRMLQNVPAGLLGVVALVVLL